MVTGGCRNKMEFELSLANGKAAGQGSGGAAARIKMWTRDLPFPTQLPLHLLMPAMAHIKDEGGN